MIQTLLKNTESSMFHCHRLCQITSKLACVELQTYKETVTPFTALYKLKRTEMYMSHHWALSEDTKIIQCLAHNHDKNLCSS